MTRRGFGVGPASRLPLLANESGARGDGGVATRKAAARRRVGPAQASSVGRQAAAWATGFPPMRSRVQGRHCCHGDAVSNSLSILPHPSSPPVLLLGAARERGGEHEFWLRPGSACCNSAPRALQGSSWAQCICGFPLGHGGEARAKNGDTQSSVFFCCTSPFFHLAIS